MFNFLQFLIDFIKDYNEIIEDILRDDMDFVLKK